MGVAHYTCWWPGHEVGEDRRKKTGAVVHPEEVAACKGVEQAPVEDRSGSGDAHRVDWPLQVQAQAQVQAVPEAAMRG